MRNSTTKNATRALVLTAICLVTNLPLQAEQRISSSEADVLHDPSVVACFAHLLREAGFGFAPVERAAFVFMNADGEFRCLDWPPTHQFKAAHWNGPIPVGVVALAHTHPVVSPYPSVDDRDEAVRIGADGISLETCFMPGFEPGYLARLKDKLDHHGLERMLAWGHGGIPMASKVAKNRKRPARLSNTS